MTIGKSTKCCEEEGGFYDSCGSACRTDPDMPAHDGNCTMQCVPICTDKYGYPLVLVIRLLPTHVEILPIFKVRLAQIVDVVLRIF